MRHLRTIVLVSLVSLAVYGNVMSPADSADSQVVRLPLTQVRIVRSGTSPLVLNLERADTPETRARGLMFRETLDPEEGMLFVFPHPEAVSFWMKNTLIPLDILYIDAGKQIVRIAENATPLSLEAIPSGVSAQYAIEIAGGRAKRDAIHVGDRVKFALPEGYHAE